MKLFKIPVGALLQHEGNYYLLSEDWDSLINRNDVYDDLKKLCVSDSAIQSRQAEELEKQVLAPIGQQEIWAAGVTYLRSRDARMEESKKSGGADFYDMVYEAERPELFFKALAQRVAGPNEDVFIRRDSDWNVPEPELTLFINSSGLIQGYTVGNDMSSRSIEGENPLYLPQAKVYDRSAALGPCLYITDTVIDPGARIQMNIFRKNQLAYQDAVAISRMKRSHTELVSYLFRECEFPAGVFLMTGTCLVPPNDFTLDAGDIVEITIDGIGTLRNTVARKTV